MSNQSELSNKIYTPFTHGDNPGIDLCGAHPANQSYWTQESDKSEVSCSLITDPQSNTGILEILTGSHTKLSTQDICNSITADLREQKACNKKLKDLGNENGEVKIALNQVGNFTWKPEILWDRPEYSAFSLTDAVLQASYTQDAPPRDVSLYLDIAKEPAVIASTALVVIAAISYISYWTTRSWIKKTPRGSAKSGTSSQLSQSDTQLATELPAHPWTQLPAGDHTMNQEQKKSSIQDTPSMELTYDKNGNAIYMPRPHRKGWK